jgi:hypothetical protein
VINQIIREGNRADVSQSINSEICSDNGHMIISLKFFKFVTEDDFNQEQRVFYFNSRRLRLLEQLHLSTLKDLIKASPIYYSRRRILMQPLMLKITHCYVLRTLWIRWQLYNLTCIVRSIQFSLVS